MALALGGSRIIGLANPTSSQNSTTKSYMDGQCNLRVAKNDDIISVALAMVGNTITGLPNPTSSQDAATKYYVDDQGYKGMMKTFDNTNGALTMGGSKITDLSHSTSCHDAATKMYVAAHSARQRPWPLIQRGRDRGRSFSEVETQDPCKLYKKCWIHKSICL